MKLKRASSRVAAAGPADWFTGQVWMDELATLPGTAVRALRVTFSPGARTAWHAHPGGQVLHVVDGVGRVHSAGGPVRQLRAGDTVVAGPGEQHWHGAAPGPAHVPRRDLRGRSRHRCADRVSSM